MNSIHDAVLKSVVTRRDQDDERLFIDAGVGHLRLRVCGPDGLELENAVLANHRDHRAVLAERRITERFGEGPDARIYITGKLALTVHKALRCGRTFPHAAALWLAARKQCAPGEPGSLAMVEISASGYTLVGVDSQGNLKDDLLAVNPRCGAGAGLNVDRVLQKLGLTRDQVDEVLAAYLGESGREMRDKITTRADRCGVFGSSATISDKNQGIPLAVALATTLKSELLKVFRKLPPGFKRVVMVGRFFHWRFVRDCAEDYLRAQGLASMEYDPENTRVLDAMHHVIQSSASDRLVQPDVRLRGEDRHKEYPAFPDLKAQLEANHHYRRIPSAATAIAPDLECRTVDIGLDVGSTMAKVVVADEMEDIVFLNATSNAGDTIATVKRIFLVLRDRGIEALRIRSIGITGSARYQVREALSRIYPQLVDRISVLVENYAHARGSVDLARRHLAELRAAGISNLNEDFCLLVDIGGEDTKVSTLALKEAEMFNNAMNIKCSAGTGSLMETLAALFGITGPREASQEAMAARKAFEINATCAVFLVENAQKLQAQGVARQEIFASANWAIVENMARTLWSQIELPSRAVVLLHGQTMLSDPLPLAVTHRLQSHLGEPAYGLVPPFPGHRACFGLIRTTARSAPAGTAVLRLADLLEAEFDKRIIQCRGAACDDSHAVCNRTSLRCKGSDGRHFSFTLGGCSAINELMSQSRDCKEGHAAERTRQPKDTYKEIWDFIDARHPRSDDPRRLVIPRSFVVSEWAYFLSEIFAGLGLPTHVDNVRAEDLTAAQPRFDVDSCAPHMGVVGQMSRLAGDRHGIILAPQIERLPTDGVSLGRTCTLNQGGMAVGRGLAQLAQPGARIHLFSLDLSCLESGYVCDQLFDRLAPVFQYYDVRPGRGALTRVIEKALEARQRLRAEVTDLAGDLIEEARESCFKVALVVGREYMLTPGIYDSHVRRLLRDKQMAAIPSYVFDIELDESFDHIYWRNPHLFSTILHAVAERRLHERIRQPRLAALIREMEQGKDLLPVVQISTFCCGPDSVTLPLAAELMKKRPYLLIQSDAVIKELAHLENRVNTYVRQLELGLHAKLKSWSDPPFEICALDQMENDRPLNRDTDVIYFPTISDNRFLTSVLRGAGFTCIDNYTEGHDLKALIKRGRRALGDSVCAPMAGVYGDLLAASEDFARRQQAGDSQVAGKTRLLFFDNAGSGPCRQGQYVEVHKFSAYRRRGFADGDERGCISGMEAVLRFLVAREANGYDFGIEEWTLLRIYQVAVLQGVLHDMLFTGGAQCRDYDEYKVFCADYLEMKEEIFAALESFRGPGPLGQKLASTLGAPAKYFAFRLHGRDLTKVLSPFRRRWIEGRRAMKPLLSIHVTGEVYMRVAQAEDIFRTLLSILGFRRFELEVAPAWGYLEYLIEEAVESAEGAIKIQKAALSRTGHSAGRSENIAKHEAELRRAHRMRWMLRLIIARPLYHAAGIPMPRSAADTMHTAREVIPTLRPIGELGPYVGEVLTGLREGTNLFINVAPTGCMVSAMGQVLTPCLRQGAGSDGRIQHLFSADGEVNEELLSVAVLKSLGPEGLFLREAG